MIKFIWFELLKLCTDKIVKSINVCMFIMVILYTIVHIYVPDEIGISIFERAELQNSYKEKEPAVLLQVLQEEMDNIPIGYSNKRLIIDKIIANVHILSEYSGHIVEILENKNDIKRTTYAERDFRKSIEKYEKLKNKELQAFNCDGIEWLINSKGIDFLIIGTMMVWLFSLVLREIDKECLAYLRIMKKGKAILLSKWILLFIINILITLALYGTSVVVVYGLVGGPELNSPVQCIVSLVACPYVMTVGEFYFFFLSFKILIIFLCMSILFVLALMLRNYLASFATFISILLGEYLLVYVVDSHSIYRILSDVNLITVMNVKNCFEDWKTLNILGKPVELWIFQYISIIVGIIYCVYISGTLFEPPSSLDGVKVVWSTKQKRKSCSLMWHEEYKLWISHHGLILLILLIVGQVVMCQSIRINSTTEEKYYRQYHEQMSLYAISEKKEFIENIEKELQVKREKLSYYSELFSRKEISEKEYRMIEKNYSDNDIRIAAWERVKNDYYRIEEIRERGIEAECIPQSGWELLTGDYGKKADYILFIVLEIVLILGIFNYITNEYESGMDQLIKIYPKGNDMFKKKHLATMNYSIVMMLVSLWPRRIAIIHKYRMSIGQFSCHSISMLEEWPSWLSLLGMWICKLVLETILVISISWIILRISKHNTNKYRALLISCLIIFLTFILWQIFI